MAGVWKCGTSDEQGLSRSVGLGVTDMGQHSDGIGIGIGVEFGKHNLWRDLPQGARTKRI